MDPLVRKGVLKGKEDRNRLLMEMTEEVAALVLADNESQARALTLDGLRSAASYEEFVALIENMLGAGVLNRADDAIPTREEMMAGPWAKKGLPRPLLAVLLGHTKMYAFEMVMQTEFPESAAGAPLLEAYFPRRIRESFREHLKDHALRREIIATAAVNHLVNNAGITFLSRMLALTKAGIGDIVAAYLEADRSLGGPAKREAILAKGQSADAEHRALLELEESLEQAAQKALRSSAVPAPVQ
jgi:glutamate dehydrogenase